MKKLKFVAGLTLLCCTGFSQPVKTAPAKQPAKTSESVLKTLEDSASYAVGVSVANFYKQQGIKKLNSALVTKAIEDVMSGKQALLDNETANTCMNTYMSRMQEEKSKPRIDSGNAFLAKNKTKPGIFTTASGLQYEVLREGTGVKPTSKDSVTCHYRGTLLDGTPFDNSYDRGEPITFSLGGVIKGWTEGLQLMTIGSKYKLYIPYNLAYGAFDYGPIPGGSLLVFEVELLDVKKVE